MDPRATKVHGDFESESLVKNIVARGLRDGWLVRFDRTPGKTGSEMLYLVESACLPAPTANALVEPPSPVQILGETSAAVEKVDGPVVKPLDHPKEPTAAELVVVAPTAEPESAAPEVEQPKKTTKSNLPERTALMELQIQDEKIGSLTETRELFLECVGSILATKGEKTIVVSNLFTQAEAAAKKLAEERGYTAEKYWSIAKRCNQRLMLKAGALLTERDGNYECILEGVGDESTPVAKLDPEFRLLCLGYLAETVIRRLGKIHFKDDYFFLGMALLRRGVRNKVDAEQLRIEADRVLAFLIRKGRIELVGTEIRLVKQSALTDRVRVIGS
jgi:hypothetical protein